MKQNAHLLSSGVCTENILRVWGVYSISSKTFSRLKQHIRWEFYSMVGNSVIEKRNDSKEDSGRFGHSEWPVNTSPQLMACKSLAVDLYLPGNKGTCTIYNRFPHRIEYAA